jgi:murein DD-endopeptidase MepM/ murein hydrolase activator NlpD
MKVILINQKHGGSRSIELGRWSRAVLSLCCLGLPLGIIAVGYLAGLESDARSVRTVALGALQGELDDQAQELDGLRAKAQRKLKALTLNLAELQARMIRLDALGEHLTGMANLEEGEFDFSRPPALGGPIADEFNVDYTSVEISGEFDVFAAKLSDREQQLELLESLLANRKLEDQAWLSGRPTEKGWISSHYGQRTDPFSGRLTMHKGLDIAGKAGSNIIAAASGVVTWTGPQSGYGQMVEISHGEGFVTRYAHNRENLVELGDMVKKGQTIALMGSSGRSTGAHVHYEVYRNGRTVDPASYVHRTQR